MKRIMFLTLMMGSFLSLSAQEISQVNLQLISKKSRVQIWRSIQPDTTYYLAFMNDKYEVLKDQSITKLSKQQLKDLSALIQRMSENLPGEYQVKTDYGLFLFMNKGEKSYWLTIYDTSNRYIKMKSNLVNIALKDISLQ